jgi:hypothetical protein
MLTIIIDTVCFAFFMILGVEFVVHFLHKNKFYKFIKVFKSYKFIKVFKRDIFF